MPDPYYKTRRWARLRSAALRRDGYECQYYRRYGKHRSADTVHHIFPRDLFPEYENELWNLAALSAEAHDKMHDRNTGSLTAIGRELMERTALKMGIEIEEIRHG